MDTKIPIKEAVRETINDESNINDLSNFVEHKFENEKWNIQRDLESFGHNIFKENFQKNEEKLLKQLEMEPNKITYLITECKKIKKEFENKMEEFADMFYALCTKNNLSETDFYYKSKGLPSYFKKIKTQDYAEPNSYVKKESKFKDLLTQTEDYRTEHLILYNSADILLKYIHQLKLLNAISQKISVKNKEENRFILAGANRLLSGLIGEQDSSFVYEKIGTQIQSIIIDEFQDTSELQWKNFRNLISEILANNRFGMLLGDVKQSIYRWRNSDWKILNNITKDIPQVKIETLGMNYRSAKNIVEYNNFLFKNAAEKIGIEAIKTAYCDVAQKNIETESGYVSVHFVAGKIHNSYKTENSENVMLDEIEKQIETLLHGGVSEGDICILCRKNEQIRKIANRISNRKIISEEAYQLKSSKEIQMLISAFKVIAEPRDYIAKAEIFLAENGNINELLKEKVENILAGIDTKLPLYELAETLCRKFKFNEKKECSAFLFAFMDKLADYISKNTGDVKKFLEYWEERLCEESLPLPLKGKRDRILIMSIHKSKGLQFHSVIVPFVDWAMNEHSKQFNEHIILCEKKEHLDLEIMPVEYKEKMKNSIFAEEYRTESEAQKMDNLNVLYVALTRAEKNLIVIAREPSKTSLEKNEFKNIQDFIYDYNKEKMGVILSKRKAETESDNPFREVSKIKQNVFWNANPVNAKIYPSTEAILFAKGESGEFVKDGNIIHKIFENINTFDTIESAVQNSVSLGILPQNKNEEYIDKIKNFILNSGKKEWFSDEYAILNECSIVMKNGEEKRPDRVIVKENNAIVIDYKTGKEKAEHKKQVREYAKFLSQMGYENVNGYLWYLYENKVVEVSNE
ncbi:MAG: UvrD-helicase domain-containing protein [Fibromonadaceae bacterium]|jgi:ATP-dependent exoDNAse (exonuclease V) beta subunit|nr:UvrD-helicase domain-containing protein [Fibromonadaceae bacterium]